MTADSLRMDDTRMDMGAMLRAVLSRWLRVVLLTILLLVGTYAVLIFVPKMYESSASILVEARDNAFNGPAGSTGSSSGGAAITIDQVISSQVELIKSRDTLLTVIESLKLRDVPEFNGAASSSPLTTFLTLIGRKPEVKSVDEAVLANLNDRLTVIRERDSAIISIFVRSVDPQRAADIANAIAKAHVQRRADQSTQDTAEASQWLEQEIVKLRQRVNEAEKAVADYRVAHNLLPTGSSTLVDQQLTTITTQISAAQERRNTASTRSQLIRGLVEAGQPIDGIADVQNSVVIQRLSQSKADLQGQFAQLSSTLLPNHPTMRAIRAQIAEVNNQIAVEGRRVATALEAEAKVESDLIASLQAEMTKLKASASDATIDTVTLDGLEREAKAQRDILESYLLRYRDAVSRSESSSTLPDVRVVTDAAPSTTPASPKTTLILAAVGFIALALQIGGIVFGELMSGRALGIAARVEDEEEPEPRAAIVSEVVSEEPELPFESPPPPSEPEFVRHREQPLDVAGLEPVSYDAFESAPMVESEMAEAEHPPEPEPVAIEPDPVADVDPVVVAETEPMPEPVAERHNSYAPAEPDVASLSSDVALGRVRVVVIAAIGAARDATPVAEALISDALGNGLSVAHVDAASGRPTLVPGLTDLTAGKASFGDIVHKGDHPSEAFVPWGTIATIDRRSGKPVTLIEALADIYEVVIVTTGRMGMTSPLPLFAGLDCRLLLVAGHRMDPELVGAALSDAEAFGFDAPELIAAPVMQAAAEVA